VLRDLLRRHLHRFSLPGGVLIILAKVFLGRLADDRLEVEKARSRGVEESRSRRVEELGVLYRLFDSLGLSGVEGSTLRWFRNLNRRRPDRAKLEAACGARDHNIAWPQIKVAGVELI
jgi:hypothetical protein